MRTIGIIGGMGWEATACYYRVINSTVQRELGGWHSAHLVMESLNFEPIASAQTRAEFRQVEEQLMASARRLQGAGAAGVLMACNTVHRFADSVQGAVNIPLLHIADAAGQRLKAAGHQRVGLLGTRPTMQASFYRERLAALFELEVHTPPVADYDALQAIITEELVCGRLKAESRKRLDAWVIQLKAAGCSAVLLGCTELRFAFGENDDAVLGHEVPLFDTAVIHAEAAAHFLLTESA